MYKTKQNVKFCKTSARAILLSFRHENHEKVTPGPWLTDWHRKGQTISRDTVLLKRIFLLTLLLFKIGLIIKTSKIDKLLRFIFCVSDSPLSKRHALLGKSIEKKSNNFAKGKNKLIVENCQNSAHII